MRHILSHLQRSLGPGAGPPILLLPAALCALSLRYMGVTGLTLSASDLTVSTSSAQITGTVTTDAPPSGSTSTQVHLFSSNTALATVPSSIFVSGKTRSGTFPITLAASQVGCATITARTGTETPRRAILYVSPANTQNFIMVGASPNPVVGGQSLTGGMYIGPVPMESGLPSSQSFPLSSSNPGVTVPASVTLTRTASTQTVGGTTISINFRLTGTFPIATQPVSSPTCAVIRAGTAPIVLKINP